MHLFPMSKSNENSHSLHDRIEKKREKKRRPIDSVDVSCNKSKKQKEFHDFDISTIDQSSPGLDVHGGNTEIQAAIDFRREHLITINPEESIFVPIFSFSQLNFPPKLVSCLQSFSKPTPIQSQCWPIILAGRDIVAIAETGSGKTLGFCLPLLYRLDQSVPSIGKKRPRMLTLTPTRELAMQIAEVCDKVGREVGICTVCVVGGVHRSTQKKQLKRGADIVVATPGRLLDLATEDGLSLDSIEYFVLDEADRMLDMGFEKDIHRIANRLPGKRQTLMFSATWPKSVQSICEQYLMHPIRVTIGKVDQLNANRNIKQIVEVIDSKNRDARLRELLKKYHDGKNKVIVFVLYKKEASRIEQMLRERGWNVQGLHSDKNQTQRTIAMNSFKCGQCPLLVSTDVAARGVDIEDVEYVINYSFPLVIEDYIHRIGRTGRSGKSGTAHTFFTLFDKKHSGALIQLLKEAKQFVPPELLKFGTAIQEKEPKIGKIELNLEKNDDHLIFD